MVKFTDTAKNLNEAGKEFMSDKNMVDARQTADEMFNDMQEILTHEMGLVLSNVVKLAAMA